MTTSSLVDFCDLNDIKWFPISLTITDNKQKILNPIDNSLYNGRPKMTDFKELDDSILISRQKLLKDEYWSKHLNAIAMDTSKVFHIDIDTPDYDDGFDAIAETTPYFKSMTKSYGKHILITADDFTPESKRIQFTHKGVELLCGQWSYAPLEIFNSDKPIQNLLCISEMLQIKHTRNENCDNGENDETDEEIINRGEQIKNLSEIEQLLECIGSSRCSTGKFKEWYEVGQAIKNEMKNEGNKFFISWTNKYGSENKKNEAYDQITKHIKYTPKKDKKRLTISSLHYWAKEANERLYYLLFAKPENKPNENSFDNVKEKFELTHAKIINTSSFIKEHDNKIIFMNRTQVLTSYEHLTFVARRYDEAKEKVVEEEKPFIMYWLKCPNIRVYEQIGLYPPPLETPKNTFNLWRAFDMELMENYENKEDELQMILNHIRVLCNNDEQVYNYFVKWIGQMIKYPATKTVCPTLISKEGAGKGTLMRLFEKMLGSDKVYETTKPSRDVWGDFNGRMANTFLVNFNELGKKETIESMNYIKGLITDPKITINNKGVSQYDINSFHRFIITTNNEEPITTTKDDRRKIIIRSSDELIGNKEYFDKMYKVLEDVNVIKTCYEYFKNIDGLDKFLSIPMPTTEYQEELKQLSTNPIENWLSDFVARNAGNGEEIVSLTSKEAYSDFKDWLKQSGIQYELNNIQFSVRLKRLNMKGIEFKRTKTDRITEFNIPILSKICS